MKQWSLIAASATVLDCPPERAWAEVQTTRLLHFIAWPLVVFEPLSPAAFPETWSAGEYLVRMRVFGVLPFGTQWIRISRPVAEPSPGQQCYILRDDGSGEVIPIWDHWIIIRELADGRTHYTDQVRVGAGLLTPFIWAYASLFYRYRQHRWRQLVRRGFVY